MTEKPNDEGIEISEEYFGLSEFLKEIFELDQSASNHIDNAPRCLSLLMDRKKDFIGTPLEKLFWNSVSLESFHVAQLKAMSGCLDEVKIYLNQALDAAQKGVSDEWLSYVRGTKCYFDCDLVGLQKEQLTAGESGRVLKGLHKGLKERGSVNYAEDYGRTC